MIGRIMAFILLCGSANASRAVTQDESIQVHRHHLKQIIDLAIEVIAYGDRLQVLRDGLVDPWNIVLIDRTELSTQGNFREDPLSDLDLIGPRTDVHTSARFSERLATCRPMKVVLG